MPQIRLDPDFKDGHVNSVIKYFGEAEKGHILLQDHGGGIGLKTSKSKC